MNLSNITASRLPPFFSSPQARPTHFVEDLAPPKSLVQRVGTVTVWLYLFALFSVLTEVSTELFGFRPYVSIVVGPLAILLTILSGQLLRMAKTRTGIWTLLFLGWLLIAAPFTSWRTGTLGTLTDAFFRSYSIVFMLGAMATTIEDCKRVIYVIAAGGLSVFLVSWFYGRIGSDGRFAMSFGSLTNSNDLATHLLIILPICLMVASITKCKRTLRPLALALVPFILYTTLRTSSRAAIISLAVMTLILLSKASPSQRIITAICLVILGAVGVAVLPGSIWERFASTYSGDVDVNDVSYGAASREGRIAELRRSVEVTLQHPVVGVGPGVYIEYDAKEAEKSSKRASWLGTHNSYTEVSAEDGIPALIFFAGAIVASFLACSRVYKMTLKREDMKQVNFIALFLMVTIAGLAINIFFSHIAYRYYIPSLLGLSISLQLAVRSKFAQEALSATTPVGSPGSPPFRSTVATPIRTGTQIRHELPSSPAPVRLPTGSGSRIRLRGVRTTRTSQIVK